MAQKRGNWVLGSRRSGLLSGEGRGQSLFWTSLDCGVASNAPLRFLKTIKDIDMKLTPLERRELNLLLLSYLTVAKAPCWIFMAAILDFRALSKRCQNLFFRFKFVE